MDRARRLGQMRQVIVYRLIIKGRSMSELCSWHE